MVSSIEQRPSYQCKCRNMTRATLDILTSPEIIAINQDPLGVAGDLVWKQGPVEVAAFNILSEYHMLPQSVSTASGC